MVAAGRRLGRLGRRRGVDAGGRRRAGRRRRTGLVDAQRHVLHQRIGSRRPRADGDALFLSVVPRAVRIAQFHALTAQMQDGPFLLETLP